LAVIEKLVPQASVFDLGDNPHGYTEVFFSARFFVRALMPEFAQVNAASIVWVQIA